MERLLHQRVIIFVRSLSFRRNRSPHGERGQLTGPPASAPGLMLGRLNRHVVMLSSPTTEVAYVRRAELLELDYYPLFPWRGAHDRHKAFEGHPPWMVSCLWHGAPERRRDPVGRPPLTQERPVLMLGRLDRYVVRLSSPGTEAQR